MGLKVVYGAPCSGKSTWVRENKKATDIVYDYDEITRAITYGKEHLSKREITHQYILDIRMNMIKRYRTNIYGDGNWRKGMRSTRILNSLSRHLQQYIIGDKEEDHLSAIIFNAFCLMLNEEKFADNEEVHDLDHWRKEMNL